MASPRRIPEAFHTERLLIRCPREGDGAALNAAIRESIVELRPWMAWAQSEPAVEDTEENLRHAAADYRRREELRLLLFLRGGGELVGCSGLHAIDWSIPKLEIGYWCRTACTGHGYITEAVRGITRFAFDALGAQRVAIRCDRENERSRRVAERAGYHLEGLLRRDQRREDATLRDTLLFSLVREEFEALDLPPISTSQPARTDPRRREKWGSVRAS